MSINVLPRCVLGGFPQHLPSQDDKVIVSRSPSLNVNSCNSKTIVSLPSGFDTETVMEPLSMLPPRQ